MANSFFVEPANPLQALLAGTQGYEGARKRTKEAEQEAALKELGGVITAGNVDYNQAAGIAARMGKPDIAISLLKTGQEQAAQKDFTTRFGTLLGGPETPQQPASAMPSAAASPLTELYTRYRAPAAGEPPQPQPMGRPVQQATEGIISAVDQGRDIAPQINQPAPPQQPPQQMAQAPFAGGKDQTRVAPRSNPVEANNVARLMAIMSHPGATAGQRKVAEIALAEAIKTPDNLREYDYYTRQTMAAGQQPLPLLDWTIKIKQAGATAITNDMRGENEESKAFGKGAGERGSAMMAAASAAAKKLADINRSEVLLSGLEQGKIEPARMTVSAWAKSLGLPDGTAEAIGLNPRAVGDAQALQALTAKSVVSMIGQGGFPANNFSDADREFLISTVERLSNEPRANKIILETGRRVAQLDIARAKEWSAFRRNPENKGKGFGDFEIEWNDKIARADLFGDLRKDAEQIVGQQHPPQSGQPSRMDIDAEIRRRGLR